MFNRKLKNKLTSLENKIMALQSIVKLSIKCSVCGDSANYATYRKYEYDSENNGKLIPCDSLLCSKCINKLRD